MFNPATYQFSAHSSQQFTLQAGQQIDLCFCIYTCNYKDFSWIVLRSAGYFALGSSTHVTNFSPIKACIPELQPVEQFLCLCKKKKKNFGHSYLSHNLLQIWNVAFHYTACRRALPQQMWCSSDKRSWIYKCAKITTLLFLLKYTYSLLFARAPSFLGHTIHYCVS